MNHREFTSHQAAWICRKGHRSTVWLFPSDNHTLLGTSKWDFCKNCSQRPSQPQVTRMKLAIFSKWLKAELVDPQEYARYAHGAVAPEIKSGDPADWDGPFRLPYRPDRPSFAEIMNRQPR